MRKGDKSSKKDQAEFPDLRQLKEILDGVDAVGTIVDEDLGYLRQRLSELQESTSRIHDDLAAIKLDQKVLENNQNEIMETLKMLTEKMDRLEIRIAESGQEPDKLSEMVDDEL